LVQPQRDYFGTHTYDYLKELTWRALSAYISKTWKANKKKKKKTLLPKLEELYIYQEIQKVAAK